MEAVNDEEASLRALARIVRQDPRLTGEMLRNANSALYRVSATPVESIERAAALLGTRGIRMLISGVLLEPLARTSGRSDRFGEIIWEQSTCSSAAADAWAARNQDADPFAAQMLALLHGLGAVTVRVVLAGTKEANWAAMVVVPTRCAVAVPLLTNSLLMVATVSSDEDQRTSADRSDVDVSEKVPWTVNVCVSPFGRDGSSGAIVKAVMKASVTVRVKLSAETPARVAVIVAGPARRALTRPGLDGKEKSTMFACALLQVTCSVMSRVKSPE
jgi:hypothetical protein